MHPSDKALRAIDAAVAEVARLSGPVTLDDEYLRAIERVEAMPENQSGADKTWKPSRSTSPVIAGSPSRW